MTWKLTLKLLKGCSLKLKQNQCHSNEIASETFFHYVVIVMQVSAVRISTPDKLNKTHVSSLLRFSDERKHFVVIFTKDKKCNNLYIHCYQLFGSSSEDVVNLARLFSSHIFHRRFIVTNKVFASLLANLTFSYIIFATTVNVLNRFIQFYW